MRAAVHVGLRTLPKVRIGSALAHLTTDGNTPVKGIASIVQAVCKDTAGVASAAEVGLERIKHRVSDMPDRMEQENVEFYGKVREGYLHLANNLPDRFFVVDGLGEVDDIEIMIWNEIHSRFFADD